jgi:dUTP pyrophosphatase
MGLYFYRSPRAKELNLEFKAPRELDAGFDLPCAQEIEIAPGQRALISTGIHMAIPENFVGLIKDRSSVASKRGGVTAAGVIDAAYRGEVKVLMYNLGDTPLSFSIGDRVAQCLIVPHFVANELVEVSDLDELGSTQRGDGGFGSTGV